MPPKEDGEIGEAIQDVLARHPDLTSPPMQAYKRIEKLSEHATPGVEQVVGRCLSAALSPVEGAKVSPDTAMVGLVVAEQCLLKREYNWAVESYKREHRHWPSEEEDMQDAVSEKIDILIAEGDLPPNWHGRTKRRR